MNTDAELNPLCSKEKLYNEKLGKHLSNVTLHNVNEKCTEWLENSFCSDDDFSICSDCSDTSGSSLYSNVTDTSEAVSFVSEKTETSVQNNCYSAKLSRLPIRLFKKKEQSSYDGINIYKSRDVHIGDIFVINGPVTLKSSKPKRSSNLQSDASYSSLGIVSRVNWLAQPPISERQFLNEPAQYVIICHTATEEGFTQAENTLLVRLIQTFHIESRKWSDIAYNFLIGSDSLIYEGRGWKVQGAHTKSFNHNSIGIAFIGCFLKNLPPSSAIKKAKNLIDYGVSEGYISKDYHLVAHCQCRRSVNPGHKLYEEIQTWDHWDNAVNI